MAMVADRNLSPPHPWRGSPYPPNLSEQHDLHYNHLSQEWSNLPPAMAMYQAYAHTGNGVRGSPQPQAAPSILVIPRSTRKDAYVKSKVRFESRPKLAPIPEKIIPFGNGSLTQSEKDEFFMGRGAGDTFGKGGIKQGFERNNNIELSELSPTLPSPSGFQTGEFTFDGVFVHEPGEGSPSRRNPRLSHPRYLNGHMIPDRPHPYTDISDPLSRQYRRTRPSQPPNKRSSRKFCAVVCIVIALVIAGIGASAVAIWLTTQATASIEGNFTSIIPYFNSITSTLLPLETATNEPIYVQYSVILTMDGLQYSRSYDNPDDQLFQQTSSEICASVLKAILPDKLQCDINKFWKGSLVAHIVLAFPGYFGDSLTSEDLTLKLQESLLDDHSFQYFRDKYSPRAVFVIPGGTIPPFYTEPYLVSTSQAPSTSTETIGIKSSFSESSESMLTNRIQSRTRTATSSVSSFFHGATSTQTRIRESSSSKATTAFVTQTLSSSTDSISQSFLSESTAIKQTTKSKETSSVSPRSTEGLLTKQTYKTSDQFILSTAGLSKADDKTISPSSQGQTSHAPSDLVTKVTTLDSKGFGASSTYPFPSSGDESTVLSSVLFGDSTTSGPTKTSLPMTAAQSETKYELEATPAATSATFITSSVMAEETYPMTELTDSEKSKIGKETSTQSSFSSVTRKNRTPSEGVTEALSTLRQRISIGTSESLSATLYTPFLSPTGAIDASTLHQDNLSSNSGITRVPLKEVSMYPGPETKRHDRRSTQLFKTSKKDQLYFETSTVTPKGTPSSFPNTTPELSVDSTSRPSTIKQKATSVIDPTGNTASWSPDEHSPLYRTDRTSQPTSVISTGKSDYLPTISSVSGTDGEQSDPISKSSDIPMMTTVRIGSVESESRSSNSYDTQTFPSKHLSSEASYITTAGFATLSYPERKGNTASITTDKGIVSKVLTDNTTLILAVTTSNVGIDTVLNISSATEKGHEATRDTGEVTVSSSVMGTVVSTYNVPTEAITRQPSEPGFKFPVHETDTSSTSAQSVRTKIMTFTKTKSTPTSEEVTSSLNKSASVPFIEETVAVTNRKSILSTIILGTFNERHTSKGIIEDTDLPQTSAGYKIVSSEVNTQHGLDLVTMATSRPTMAGADTTTSTLSLGNIGFTKSKTFEMARNQGNNTQIGSTDISQETNTPISTVFTTNVGATQSSTERRETTDIASSSAQSIIDLTKGNEIRANLRVTDGVTTPDSRLRSSVETVAQIGDSDYDLVTEGSVISSAQKETTGESSSFIDKLLKASTLANNTMSLPPA